MQKVLTEDDRRNLAGVLMDMFEQWGLSSENQLALMGYPKGTAGRELRRLRQGSPFPQDADQLHRAEQLLAIQDCLRTAYPRSGSMAEYWLNQPNRHFKKRSPLAVMLDGVDGLREVRVHLDCTQNWI